jgi:hypothetical protein
MGDLRALLRRLTRQKDRKKLEMLSFDNQGWKEALRLAKGVLREYSLRPPATVTYPGNK